MTQRSDGLYTAIGTDPWRPKWFLKVRGLYWLRSGLCPWCYSSPPHRACVVCHGDYEYFGAKVSDLKRAAWRRRFLRSIEARAARGEGEPT